MYLREEKSFPEELQETVQNIKGPLLLQLKGQDILL